MPHVVVLDYGSGNLLSASRALARTGVEVEVTSDRARAIAADGLVVPGVGAFGACMAGLLAVGGDEIIAARLAAGRATLGICVGLQVLFGRGVEHGVQTPGLGIWPDPIERLDAPILPHMGWNTVSVPEGSKLFAGVTEERFYFVHSFAAKQFSGEEPAIVTRSHYGEDFVAAVESENICATQFHPEKSGWAGARLLENWVAGLQEDL